MILFRRAKAERRRVAIVQGLFRLQKEFPRQRQFIGYMILYAEVGRDRMRLPDNYVTKVRSQCEKFEKRFLEVGW